MDQANLERTLTGYFQTEVDGANLEPSVQWWRNLLGSYETAKRITGLAAAGERFGAWWHRPAIKLRSAVVAVPVMIIMILLAVLQPWTPGGGGTTVMAMDELIEKVNNLSIHDNLLPYRVIICESATIDNDGNINYQSDIYEFDVFLDKIHLKKIQPDGKTGEVIFIEGKKYYSGENISIDYLTATNISGGTWTKEKTLTLLRYLEDYQQLPDESIDGEDCLHYKGISQGTLGTEKGSIELWVQKDDYLIRQIIQISSEQIDTGLISTKEYEFIPITVKAPINEAGNLITGWSVDNNPQVIYIKLSQKWIQENDTLPDPTMAKVTFPTSWLTTPPSIPDSEQAFICAFSGDLNTIPSDVDNVIPGMRAIKIGEQETTLVFGYTTPAD